MPDSALVVRGADVDAISMQTGAFLRPMDGERFGFGTFSLNVGEYPPGTSTVVKHRHDHFSAIVVSHGRGRFTVGDETFAAEAGDVVLVPANAWHIFENDGEETLRIVGVHDAVRHSAEVATNPGVTDAPTNL
jgi:quercetin dioxygenase-like cupin family protein